MKSRPTSHPPLHSILQRLQGRRANAVVRPLLGYLSCSPCESAARAVPSAAAACVLQLHASFACLRSPGHDRAFRTKNTHIDRAPTLLSPHEAAAAAAAVSRSRLSSNSLEEGMSKGDPRSCAHDNAPWPRAMCSRRRVWGLRSAFVCRRQCISLPGHHIIKRREEESRWQGRLFTRRRRRRLACVSQRHVRWRLR